MSYAWHLQSDGRLCMHAVYSVGRLCALKFIKITKKCSDLCSIKVFSLCLYNISFARCSRLSRGRRGNHSKIGITWPYVLFLREGTQNPGRGFQVWPTFKHVVKFDWQVFGDLHDMLSMSVRVAQNASRNLSRVCMAKVYQFWGQRIGTLRSWLVFVYIVFLFEEIHAYISRHNYHRQFLGPTHVLCEGSPNISCPFSNMGHCQTRSEVLLSSVLWSPCEWRK